MSRVSDKNHAEFLEDEVFRPLGMEDCFLGTDGGGSRHIAAQYDSSSHVRTPPEISDTPGASSAHCSVHDVALFGMFALGEHLPNQERILSDVSLKMMLNPTVESGDGERYGFGWTLQPNHHGYVGVFAQGGINDSFAVLQMIPSEKIAVAVIANTGTTLPFDIVDEILRDLLPRYGAALAREKPTQPTESSKAVTPTSLAGTWVGALHTWKANVPLTLEISPFRQVRVKWPTNPSITPSDVDITDPRFYCVAHGKVGAPDALKSSSEIELELYLRGATLVGAGTTKDGAQLPYWVQLEKVPATQAIPKR